jgi:hypothetical protein
MKSGTFDGASGAFKLMDQGNVREDMQRAWYNEGDDIHPFDRTTMPIAKNDIDTDGKYSWSTAVRHAEHGRLEAGPLARQLIAGGDHGEAWQHSDGLVLDMYRKLGGASTYLRHFARLHELCKLYREAERILREFRLNDEWYIKPTERDGQDGARPRLRVAPCATGSTCAMARSTITRSSLRPHGMSARVRAMASWDRSRRHSSAPRLQILPIRLKSDMSAVPTTAAWFVRSTHTMRKRARNWRASAQLDIGPPGGRTL